MLLVFSAQQLFRRFVEMNMLHPSDRVVAVEGNPNVLTLVKCFRNLLEKILAEFHHQLPRGQRAQQLAHEKHV
jgi:hypothetical protein